MLLKDLTTKNYGPFGRDTLITFEKEVTVLTGSNDAGKSSVLKLLENIYNSGTITNEDVNMFSTRQSGKPWDLEEVGADVTFWSNSQYVASMVSGIFTANTKIDTVTTEFRLAPKAIRRIPKYGYLGDTLQINYSGDFNKMPKLIRLNRSEPIRQQLSLKKFK